MKETIFKNYNNDFFTKKIWEGETVYYETICFEEDENGKISNAKLLYEPDEIIALRSADMKTSFIKGKDFEISGRIVTRPKGSKLQFAPYSEFYIPLEEAARKYPTTYDPNTSVVVRDDGRVLQRYQYAVFYTHKDGWKGVTRPKSQAQHIQKTISKLKNGENLNIVFYGDSVTSGMHTSGNKETARSVDSGNILQMPCWGNVNYAPYVPAWAEMVAQKLKSTFPNAKIKKTNCAAPSAQSGDNYGCKYIDLVNEQNPDLVVIAFGANDTWMKPEDFKRNHKTMINAVLAKNPNCEFLLVSYMIPNTKINSFFKTRDNHLAQEIKYYELQKEYSNIAGIGVVPALSFWKDLLDLGKKPSEWTSSMDTHPNDWGASIYAQLIINAFGI